jgi:hypothetical protein
MEPKLTHFFLVVALFLIREHLVVQATTNFKEDSPLSEADSYLTSQETSRFYETRRFITLSTRAHHWSIQSKMNPTHTNQMSAAFPP